MPYFKRDRPVIAVTMGDPAGIGPEVVLGALKSDAVWRRTIPVVVGSSQVLRRCIAELHIEGIEIAEVPDPRPAEGVCGKVEVIDVSVPGLDELKPGKTEAIGGLAADAFVRKACELALAGRIDAITTAPISKESLRLAGIQEIGHTELLAKYLGASDPLTLFITDNMRIFFLSRHLSLREAIDFITEDRLYRFIRKVHSAMIGLGFPRPGIGVAALNPHASDGGQFGSEEAEIISPAIERARAERIRVFGPIGADSIFHQALEGRLDCAISLYHDQGHIAAKTRDFFGTVTATLGLPVLRTSVDHGTAFDIARRGKASSVSMEAAILAAVDLLAAPGGMVDG